MRFLTLRNSGIIGLVIIAAAFFTYTTDLRPFGLFIYPENLIFTVQNEKYGNFAPVYTVGKGTIVRDESKVLDASIMQNPRLLLYDVRADTFEPISWTEAQHFVVADARQNQPSPSGYTIDRGVQRFLECGFLRCFTHGPSHTDAVKGILRRELSGLNSTEAARPLAWVIEPSRSEQAEASKKYKQRITQDMVYKTQRGLPERYKSYSSPKIITQLTLEEARLHNLPPIDYVRLFDLNTLRMTLNRNKPVTTLAQLRELWGGGKPEDALDPITGKEYEYHLKYNFETNTFYYELCAILDSKGRYCVTH
jgi:hypothetical protein